MADEKGKTEEKGNAGEKLIAEACKAYGIAPKYVLGSRIDPLTGEAVVVTVGGSKVRFKAGAEVAPLSEIAVTGVNPAWAKRKVKAK